MPPPSFSALPFAPSRTVTWVHIGDTHLTQDGEGNEIDLGRIVDEINRAYAGSIDFVFVPGDIADDGSTAAYTTFRRHLDRLRVPWFGIVGDHDVHEESFQNFQDFVSADLYSAFTVGPFRFLRLNAFADPRPNSFRVDDAQLAWIESELQVCERDGQSAVLFLHCYPSDLHVGGDRLTTLLHRYPVLLVDMGHTHYNEISNDGQVLYTATRSTGQIEEGEVGFSVTTLDSGAAPGRNAPPDTNTAAGSAVSWHFVPLRRPALLSITSPADHRLTTARTVTGLPQGHATGSAGTLTVRARAWSASPVVDAHARLDGRSVTLTRSHSAGPAGSGAEWTGDLDLSGLAPTLCDLVVEARTEDGETLTDTVRIAPGAAPHPARQPIDQNNAIAEWTERGLLGTQLGPNKNGRKW